jgi:hypothetical protein
MRRVRTALLRLCRPVRRKAKRYDQSKIELRIGGELVALGTCCVHGSMVRGHLTMVQTGGGRDGK